MNEMQQQAYEVPGRQLGWRVSQLKAQGLDYDAQPVGGGIYIVVVRQPEGVNPFAYESPHRRASRFDRARVLRVALSLMIIALVFGGLYFAFAGGGDTVTAEVGGMKLDPVTGHGIVEDDGLWGWLPDLNLPDLRWPWQGEQQAQQRGFRWPWDAAMESAAAAAESVEGTVTVALVLLIVLALVRRRG